MGRIRFLEWQSIIINDRKTSTIYLHGGVGSAKTFGKIAKHYQWITENKSCPFSWFVEPAYHKVDTIAIPGWRNYLKMQGLREDEHFSFLRSKPQQLKIHHGLGTHTVLFQSGDRPHMMVGDNIGYYTVDEAGEQKFEVIERCDQRLRDPSANYNQAVIGGAPQGMNFFAEMADFNGYKAETNELSLELWTEDNAANLSKDYIKRQLQRYGHNQAKIDSWLYGRFTHFYEGAAYPDYDPRSDRHEKEADPMLPLYILWDFNIRPLAWVGIQKRAFEVDDYRTVEKLATVGESTNKSRLIHDACAEIIAKYPPRHFANTRILVSGDASGHAGSVRADGSCYDDIKFYLSKFYKKVKIITPRNNPLQAARVEQVNRMFSYGRLLIHKEDDNTSRSLLKTSWADEHGKLHKPSKEDWTHWGDALGYGVVQIVEHEKINLMNLPTIF